MSGDRGDLTIRSELIREDVLALFPHTFFSVGEGSFAAARLRVGCRSIRFCLVLLWIGIPGIVFDEDVFGARDKTLRICQLDADGKRARRRFNRGRKPRKLLRNAGFERQAILQLLIPFGEQAALQSDRGGSDRS